MISMWLLQIAIKGLFQSFSPTPVARSRLRWAARASPRLMVSDRIAGGVDSADIVAHLGSAGMVRVFQPCYRHGLLFHKLRRAGASRPGWARPHREARTTEVLEDDG